MAANSDVVRIGVNLLNFSNSEQAGVGFFTKNIINNIRDISPAITLVFFCQERFEIESYFDPEIVKNSLVIKSPNFKRRFNRILYEQFILPKYSKKIDKMYSPTASIPFFLSVPSVITIHDVAPFALRNKYSWYRSLYVKLMTKLNSRISKTIVTVSNFSKGEICRYLNVSLDKVEVVHNFMPNKHRDPSLELECKGSEEDPFLLVVSTLHPTKNLVNTVRGFLGYIDQYPETKLRLKIAGKLGWDNERFFNLLSESDIGNRVEVLGWVSDSELAQLYSQCLGVVNLSLYEGFGVPCLEALYYNKKMLISDTTSLPEVAGKCGLRVSPDDIKEVVNGYKALVEMKVSEFEFRKQRGKFTKDSMVNSMARILL